jgi:hypothetical protein
VEQDRDAKGFVNEDGEVDCGPGRVPVLIDALEGRFFGMPSHRKSTRGSIPKALAGEVRSRRAWLRNESKGGADIHAKAPFRAVGSLDT